ncbi:MAG: HNH endonuclease [Candidatus Korobacteraceae bacterium]
MAPSSEDQVQFLLKVQRLLQEGLFTATYKFALLMALADLSVELGDDSGEELGISTEKIAEKFIEYYWRQTLPFLGKDILRQNTGRPPVVVTLLIRARSQHGDRLATARKDAAEWRSLVRSVAANIREMPLRYLQNVGRGTLPFLYDAPTMKAPSVIRLYPGVAFCFRRFHGLLAQLVQAAWTRWVHQQNLSIIGDTADLHEFLFGAGRVNLALLQRPLRDLQRNACFYCYREIRGQPNVDHFVPWAMYQLDLGHNFVLAHQDCNSRKRERLASEDHLAAWVNRNREHGETLARPRV